jgi:hypothetical protein
MNIKSILVILTAFILTNTSVFCQINLSNRNKLPILVLIETNPQIYVTGYETPAFAFYTDGTVIYSKQESIEKINYFSVKLDSTQLSTLVNELNLSELQTLEEFYNVSSDPADQQNNILFFYKGDSLKASRVYGDLVNDMGARELTPKSFLRVYDKITNIDLENSKIWMPQYIELVITPYESTKDPKDWPDDFPDLESPNTVRHGDLYSLYIDISKYEKFKILQNDRKKGHGFLISDKKWKVTVRYPFPEEDIWTNFIFNY